MPETEFPVLSASQIRAERGRQLLLKYQLVLTARDQLGRGHLELAEVLEAFGWSRAKWFRVLKDARAELEHETGDGRRRHR